MLLRTTAQDQKHVPQFVAALANKIERLDVVPRIAALVQESRTVLTRLLRGSCECGNHLRKHLHYDGHVFPSVWRVL